MALAQELMGFPAPSLPACRRLRHHAIAARRGRADRERGDGRAHRDRMGQGRSRTISAFSRSMCSASACCRACGARSICCARHYGMPLRPASFQEPRAAVYRHDVRAPTRSACSRSKAGRRCRCCRGCGRRNSTTSSSRSRSCGRGRSRATWCIPICSAAKRCAIAASSRTIRRRRRSMASRMN